MMEEITTMKETITDEWLSGIDVKDERYYSIGEVSSLCNNVKPHVLRYWESQFKNLSPVRRNDRRYYRRNDVVTIRNIYNLVHLNRYTVEGAKKYFTQQKASLRKEAPQAKVHTLKMIKALEAIDHRLLAE